jgi:molecular chaperone GrpE (heat shock protein)
LKDNDFAKWVRLIYDNMIKSLETMNVFSIESIWKEPDIELHQPIWMEKIDDKKNKWKIIKEYERWFYLLHDDKKNVIISSKVIVGE